MHMKDVFIKLFRCLLPILGFALVESCAKDMYGCPYSDFQLKGTVTDTEGEPIEGIKVNLSGVKGGQVDAYRQDEVCYTDSEGIYIVTNQDFSTFDNLHLKFEDIDGIANDGEFETYELDVAVEQTKKADGWFEGAFRAGADVELKRK